MGVGAAIALVKPLHGLDGTHGALLVRYPLAAAMAPYRRSSSAGLPLSPSLGLALLVFATWALANSITKPVSILGRGRAAIAGRRGGFCPRPRQRRDCTACEQLQFDGVRHQGARAQDHRPCIHRFRKPVLPNRRALQRRLEGVIDVRDGRRLYVAAVGIDRFPQIRGAIGYDLASSLIGGVGARISKLAPKAPLGRVAVIQSALRSRRQMTAPRLSER